MHCTLWVEGGHGGLGGAGVEIYRFVLKEKLNIVLTWVRW